MIYQGSHIDHDTEVTADVCVIGSGAGGACMAAELAEAGMKVVLLEEGPYRYGQDFRHNTIDAVKTLYRDGGSSFVFGNAKIIIAEGRCVGGSTVVNSGVCHRTPPEILQRWHEEYGIRQILPDAMESYFEKVEARLHAAPDHERIVGDDSRKLRIAAERLNYHLRVNKRNQIECCGCKNCIMGCPSGAKQSALIAYLPRALSHGADLFANCRVDHLQVRRNRITDVEGKVKNPKTGKVHRIRVHSQRVVLAGGAIQSPLLLLRNKIANSSRQVGQNLYIHPSIKVVAVYDEDIEAWKGSPQSYQIHEFMNEGILLSVNFVPPDVLAATLPYVGERMAAEMQQYNRMVVFGALVEDSHPGRVRYIYPDYALVQYRLTRQDIEAVRRALSLMSQVALASGAVKVLLPVPGLKPVESGNDLEALQRARISPRDLEMITFHIMGTCRMGENPATSVVNSFGQSHDLENLFIADASLFPSPIGINPMVTIQALATRNAEYIIQQAS